MFLKRFKVRSYFSFDQTDWIDLSPTFNVLVGTNNSGKSALLRTLSNQFKDVPHRRPDRYAPGDVQPSGVEVEAEIHPAEIFRRFSVSGQIAPIFPGSDDHGVDERWRSVLRADLPITIKAGKVPKNGPEFDGLRPFVAPNFGEGGAGYNIRYDPPEYSLIGRNSEKTNLHQIFNFRNPAAIFYFEPQRNHIGKSRFQEDQYLNSSASNLPNVISYLSGARPDVLSKISDLTRYITQSVDSIGVRPKDQDVEIVCWPTKDRSRPEFSSSLDDSGTGLAQVLAILTAASTSDQAVVVVDEINTFLHPAATKRLISVLQAEFGHHQYIISTHSSDVLGVSGSAQYYSIEREGFVSIIRPVSFDQVEDVRRVSSLMGFSMMDVFGHERIVWVEGETEQKLFSYVARSRGVLVPGGLGFATVGLTSEFEGKERSVAATIELYQHIVKSSSPLLKGMAFGLDRESRDDAAIKKLEQSKRKLRFLPRRCLECYLINSDAIGRVLRDLGEVDLKANDVEDFLIQNGGLQAYRASSLWKGKLDDVRWLAKVDGAKLLSDCFSRLTDHRHSYRKVSHGLQLAHALQEANPGALDELAAYVAQLIEIACRDSRP